MPNTRRKKGRVYIGPSGYSYPAWRGVFYPPGLPAPAWLAHACKLFNSIELNGTFYSLKSPATYQAWADAAGEGFIFAVKGSRYITHNLKLHDPERALANFYASGVLALGAKTGPFLWQLPQRMRFDPARLKTFFDLLPRSSAEAERLARRCDPDLKKGTLQKATAELPYRHAIEPRHPSFFEAPFFELLRAHHTAFVIADTAHTYPYAEEVTADFVYVRLHGSRVLYESAYDDEEIEQWAERVARWAASRDVYVYFDNTALAHAPFDALRLSAALVRRGF